MDHLTDTRATERQSRPPALPVKQRRSLYSSVGSSVDMELDGGASSPFALQNQGSVYTDVFSAPTDCHAPQCPIHQRYDPSYCHHERFFSDSTTPPPVPKKRVARALSLPGPGVDVSPLSPLPYDQHSYDNPLYMFTSVADTQPYLERQEERHIILESPLPLQPLSQLHFDTPDEQLPCFFCDFSNQEDISQGIQHRHLLFLQSMAQSLEAGPPLEGEYREVTFQPQDFLLCEGHQPNHIGVGVYYSLQSPRFPRRVLCAKVVREVTPSTAPSPQLPPPHGNVRQVIACFPPCPTPEKELNTVNTQETTTPSLSSQSHHTTPKPQSQGSVELVDRGRLAATDPPGPTVTSLLRQGFTVTIERDFPQATLEDFVIEGQSSLWSSEPLVYERRLCLLLLQLALGLQHLRDNASTTTCAELKPQDIFLVWPGSVREERGERERGEREGEEEKEAAGKINDTVERGESGTGPMAGKAEERYGRNEVMECGKKEKLNEVTQTLWRKWGSPRLVLTHRPATLSLHTQAAPTLQSQLRALLQYCLPLHAHEQAASRTQGSDNSLQSSPYLPGLLRLASWLQDERSGPQIADTVGVLQALLWGPRAELFRLNHTEPASTLHSWLSVKRALLLLKLAERGLSQDRSSLDWEDRLCLQYLSSADPGTVMRTTARLELHNTTGLD